MPLVLSRKVGESIVINPGTPDAVTVTLVDVDRTKIRLAFDAPRTVVIVRQELLNRTPQPPAPREDGFSDGIPKE